MGHDMGAWGAPQDSGASEAVLQLLWRVKIVCVNHHLLLRYPCCFEMLSHFRSNYQL